MRAPGGFIRLAGESMDRFKDSPDPLILLYSGAMRMRSIAVGFRYAVIVFLGVLSVGLPGADGLSAQEESRIRIGVSAGGIGLVGLSVEYQWEEVALDLNLATFTFSDISVSVTARRYFGAGDLRPFVGLGLWSAKGPSDDAPRDGIALLALAPIGADWQLLDDHALGTSINVNRGLWIRRSDPLDETPIGTRLIPLPAFYYRATADHRTPEIPPGG